jgi:hypothetical protein
MWVRMQTPPIPGPIWGVNWSQEDRLLVLSGAGLLELTLAPVAALRTLQPVEDLRQRFDPHRDCNLVWHGHEYPIHGPNRNGGKICHPNGDRLILHPEEDDLLVVSDIEGKVVRQVLDRFVVSGGRWSVADFTDDFRYIVVFDPEELRVFCQEAEA